jgi:hypothetical protein
MENDIRMTEVLTDERGKGKRKKSSYGRPAVFTDDA